MDLHGGTALYQTPLWPMIWRSTLCYRNHGRRPMTPRISPATAPFSPKVQAAFDAIMPPGMKPLTLFTTLARDERLLRKFFAGSLLDEGHLTLRQREIVIDRTAA